MPATPGNVLALQHGATSERHVRPLAANHRRRVLRQIGLAARDLDPIARGYLDLYVRGLARLDLMDAYAAEHGFLDAKGNPPPFTAFYVSLMNATRLALGRFEEHVRARMRPKGAALAEYLHAEYGNGDRA